MFKPVRSNATSFAARVINVMSYKGLMSFFLNIVGKDFGDEFLRRPRMIV